MSDDEPTPEDRIRNTRDRYRNMADQLEAKESGTPFWYAHAANRCEKWRFAADVLDSIMQSIEARRG